MEPNNHEGFRKGVQLIYKRLVVGISIMVVVMCMLIYVAIDPSFSVFSSDEPENNYIEVVSNDEWDKIENGIHLRTGFVDGKGLMETVNNCVSCHSSKLVIQNRMSKERWAATIDWMQETQNLWDLGDNEEIIINYLVTTYPLQKKGRRQAISNIEWYELVE